MQSDPVFARGRYKRVRAYVLKEAAGAGLASGADGGRRRIYLNPSWGPHRGRAGRGGRGSDDLSVRERDVLRLIALGHTNAEIGAQLFLSVRTVETHRSHIQRKLGRTTRAELVRYSIEHGLLDT